MSPNRLAKETSPYLKQHANNPVDWYPWGEEAFAEAKREDKPILLSIGYSSCHWCHVMERESFEDDETARVMNQNFVNMKVDREERPDLDAIYMEAVQAMTGQGGWPMTVFLTPDGKPFHAGTYFPPVDRGGLPSFVRVLKGVARLFREKRREVEGNAQTVQRSLSSRVRPRANVELDPSILENAFLQLTYSYDEMNGGFGRAPKFPQPSALELLLRLSRKKDMAYGVRMVTNTLTKMAKGGVYDHLGGGFHRYAVDSRWLVPHFEKMLYDNAQLSLIYLHTYQISRNQPYRRIVEETLDYVVREMRHPLGGFYSSQDADTEGEEGKFYTWTRDEVQEALGKPDSEVFCKFFGMSETGNFEGKNILNTPSEPQEAAATLKIPPRELERILKRGKKKLFEVREMRVKPSRDEKVLASWNGLMTKGFAEAARVLGRDDYGTVAEDNARFIRERMFVGEELMHSWNEGKAKVEGFLEDYAFVADAFLSLYLTNFNPEIFEIARSLAETILERFQDKKDGGFYDTAEGDTSLFVRPKTIFDYSTPSGGSVAAHVLQTIGDYVGDNRFREAAERAIKSTGILLEQQPMALCRWLQALDSFAATPIEVALVGDLKSPELREMLSVIFEPYRPNLVVALQPAGKDYSDKIPLLSDRTAIEGQSTAYICRKMVCLKPVTDPIALAKTLDEESKTEKSKETE